MPDPRYCSLQGGCQVTTKSKRVEKRFLSNVSNRREGEDGAKKKSWGGERSNRMDVVIQRGTEIER